MVMNAMLTASDIENTLALLDQWEDRYAYIIELGAKLPPFPEALRTDHALVPGCTSRVWMHALWSEPAQHLELWLDSDAHIVKGLLAILWAQYSGLPASGVLAVPLEDIFGRLGLTQHISPNRRNGFFAVSARIRALAEAKLG